MGHYTNDLSPLRLRRAYAKQDSLAHRRLVWKRLRRQCLIDYEQVSIGLAVVFRERPSFEKLRAHRLEVTGQNDLKISSLELTRITLCFGATPAHRTKPAGERQWKRRCRTVHTRNRVELLAKLPLESFSFLRCCTDVAEQLKRQQPARVKAHIHTLNVKESAKHQPRANQEYKRKRNLDDYHSVTQAGSAERTATPNSA